LSAGHPRVIWFIESINKLASLETAQIKLNSFYYITPVQLLLDSCKYLKTYLPTTNTSSNSSNNDSNDLANRSSYSSNRKTDSRTCRRPCKSTYNCDTSKLCSAFKLFFRYLTLLVFSVINACLSCVN
jgi:hypothetical protein